MKQSERTELTVSRIMNAALEEFGSNGYAGGTINGICKRGINKGLVYHNFRNRDELYLACLDRSCKRLVQLIEESGCGTDPLKYMNVRLRFFAECRHEARIFFEAVLQPQEALRAGDRLVEAQRLEQRTRYDIEMMREIGYCSGIENYSRYFDGREAGQRPFCLLDCMPDDFLTIIDESHVTVPQIRAMYGGDLSRKTNLVNYGFRLEAAIDNRPLRFEEFEAITGQTIYVSATPAYYELMQSGGVVTEQIIRPTGLLDPKITVRPSRGQIDDLLEEIQLRIERHERTLVTTLTKRMAEELSAYMGRIGIRCAYMHSDVETMDRIQILDDLRAGALDVLIGVNLLREGLGLPEVSLVAIIDADKEGFLRSHRSLTQTAGRAARNLNGEVIMYADTITASMKKTIDETERRRTLQLKYNEEHGITPQAIIKARNAIIGVDTELQPNEAVAKHARKYENNVVDFTPLQQQTYAEFNTTAGIAADPVMQYMGKNDLQKAIDRLNAEMVKAAKEMRFIEAAQYRDEIIKLKQKIEQQTE